MEAVAVPAPTVSSEKVTTTTVSASRNKTILWVALGAVALLLLTLAGVALWRKYKNTPPSAS